MTGSANRQRMMATLLGLLAILMWGSLVAAVRSVVAQMGVLASAAAANLAGGLLACGAVSLRPGAMRRMLALPRAYLAGCGTLFVVYNLALYLAIDRSASHAQAVEVALVNYLWPALALVLAVPILGKRARGWLVPGLILALAGVYLAVMQGRSMSWASLEEGLLANPLPYGLGLAAAVCWGLYSNLSPRWAGDAPESGVPVFLLATGIALAAGAVVGGPICWPSGARGVLELAYLALFPTWLAYLFWDIAMRRGNMVLVTSVSFFIPLISTILSCLYLGVPMTGDLWLGCGLVIAGAVVCKNSVTDRSISARGETDALTHR